MGNDFLNNKAFTISAFVKLCIIHIIVFFILFSSSCSYQYREKQYYSDQNNFIKDTAIVENIFLDEDSNTIYFWLDDVAEVFQGNTFIIKGTNVDEVIENNIFNMVQKGDLIDFISAPEYFGDGYCMPIVAISVDGQEILCFENGYKNLMKLYD